MKVAHYCIGEPYRRLGGLISYVESLIENQAEDIIFDEIYVVFPWYQTLLSNHSSLKIKRHYGKIAMVGIKNSNPESLFEGILYPKKSISNPELENAFVNFIKRNNINIVHFHSFYCLPANILSALKNIGVKIVFSAHDYQALCPTMILLDYEKKKCHNIQNGYKCIKCNRFALSRLKYYVRNNQLSHYAQSFSFLKSAVKNIVRRNTPESYHSIKITCYLDIEKASQYKLRQTTFVNNINENVDFLIYNSYLTKKIYTDFGVSCANEVIPVSHKNIKNKIEPFVANFSPQGLRFGFMGGNRTEKGAIELLEVFNCLFLSGFRDFELHFFGEDSNSIFIPETIGGNVINHGFSRNNAYNYFDILIVPSLCYETFGFVIPEALLNKKGIIASKDIGALTFINDGVVTFDSFNELKHIIEIFLTSGSSFTFSGGFEELSFREHYQKLIALYNELI